METCDNTAINVPFSDKTNADIYNHTCSHVLPEGMLALSPPGLLQVAVAAAEEVTPDWQGRTMPRLDRSMAVTLLLPSP